MKAIIVEDELHNVAVLKHFLKKYCQKVEIVGESSTVTSALQLINDTKPDLVFLDIMLEEGTGFDLLDSLKNREIQVIFITAYNNFALKAFKYSAVDYLLKPLQIEDLEKAVAKAEQRLENNTIKNQLEILMNKLSPKDKKNDDDFLAIPMIDKIEFIKINNIIFISADGKYSTFETFDNPPIISSKNIGEYEKILSDNPAFVRVHHSYLVNVNFIDSISKVDGLFCEMKNKKQIPISRRKKDVLFTRLNTK